MIAAVSLRLLYLIFVNVLCLVLLLGRAASAKDIELLVLRLEVAILRRTNPRPCLGWDDRRLRRPHSAATDHPARPSPGYTALRIEPGSCGQCLPPSAGPS
jgi:hypothetical protein